MRRVIKFRKSTPQPPIERIVEPFDEFFHTESSRGILLIISAIMALIWANSPWRELYQSVWNLRLTFSLSDMALSKPLILWINDGLMAVFFFVAGLEIKREILVGELAALRQALFPIAAALGGMVIPALIYAGFNAGKIGSSGWGIPMATDIAFALGILSLLGNRVSLGLKVFLTAVAIVDDLGAVVVIAVAYTSEIVWGFIGLGMAFWVILILCNRLGVRHPLIYGLFGTLLWVSFLKSGVHATIAGVMAAMTIPVRTRINADEFLECGRTYLAEFERAGQRSANILTNAEQHGSLQALEIACHVAEPPLQRFEHTLHPWVSFGVMPIFALANAGVFLGGDIGAVLVNPVTMGVGLGLVVGKQIGIMLFAWAVVRMGLADVPKGVSWRQIYGASWLGGIGFTMSLFIGSLAFGQDPLLDAAKVGVLIASSVSAIVGWYILARPASA